MSSAAWACSNASLAPETSTASEAAQLQALIKRQLPMIAQRLSTTLEKLKAPGQEAVAMSDASVWWDGLKQRYPRPEITFGVEGTLKDVLVPAEFFDRPKSSSTI